jgi:hypothetical protein
MGAGFFMIVAVFLFSLSSVQPTHNHGGKTHDEEAFTTMEAANKATQLYDCLIASGKLPQVLENGNTSSSLKELKNNPKPYIYSLTSTGVFWIEFYRKI